MQLSVIMLAAGLSKRMGRDKLLLPYKGKPLLAKGISLLEQFLADEKILVINKQRLIEVIIPAGITPVLNDDPQAGKSHSISLGLKQASGSHYLFMTADQPLLDIAAMMDILMVSKEYPDKIIYPAVKNELRNPVLFPAEFRDALMALRCDEGGRKVVRENPESAVAVPTNSPEKFWDIDSEKDYEILVKMTDDLWT